MLSELILLWRLMNVLQGDHQRNMRDLQWSVPTDGQSDRKNSGKKMRYFEAKKDSIHSRFLPSSSEWSLMTYVLNRQSISQVLILLELQYEDSRSVRVKKICTGYLMSSSHFFRKINHTTSCESGHQKISSNESHAASI